MQKRVRGLDELAKLARQFIEELHIKQSCATVVGLRGELGSGKTAFVQSVARELGVREAVTSPTFVIEKIYHLEGQEFNCLVHIDAYRLESGKELKALGLDALLRDTHNLIFIEWSERVEDILPESVITISFEYVDKATRRVTIHGENSI